MSSVHDINQAHSYELLEAFVLEHQSRLTRASDKRAFFVLIWRPERIQTTINVLKIRTLVNSADPDQTASEEAV